MIILIQILFDQLFIRMLFIYISSNTSLVLFIQIFYYATFILPFVGFIIGWGTDSLPDIFYKKVLI